MFNRGWIKCPNSLSTDRFFSIDHTYKNYIGGAQKRPDAYYSRPVHNSEGEVVGVVSESNRKDVRDAVEAAKKASAGYGVLLYIYIYDHT